MSSLWTPSGEHPVDRPGAGSTSGPARPAPDLDRGPGAPTDPERELTPEERAAADEYARQLEAAREQLLSAPAGLVIGQQALQFYELAALHLSQPEPRLDDARTAIDALAAVVGALGPRLGEAEAALRQALNQLQLAFVEVSTGDRGAGPGGARAGAGCPAPMTRPGGTGSGTGTPPAPPPVARPRVIVVLAVVAAVAAVVAVLAVAGSWGDDDAPGTGPDIAIVGDSLIEQSRDQFAAHAGDLGLSVEALAFGGSAPCDWRDEFERFAEAGVETLIVSFAGNDSTPCVNPAGGGFRDPQTIAGAYAAMVPELLDLYAGSGTDIYLVVPPPVGPPGSEPAAAAIRSVYRAIADERDDVTLVDPGPALSPDGAFHASLPCEAWEADVCAPDGTVAVRNADGVHLTPAGGERYARALLDAVGHPVPG